ncbi:MAG: hypothetical protein LUF26_01985 [Firmicutes bacterium]|nr:hypothetical protein [Bacillota bacterium]
MIVTYTGKAGEKAYTYDTWGRLTGYISRKQDGIFKTFAYKNGGCPI